MANNTRNKKGKQKIKRIKVQVDVKQDTPHKSNGQEVKYQEFVCRKMTVLLMQWLQSTLRNRSVNKQCRQIAEYLVKESEACILLLEMLNDRLFHGTHLTLKEKEDVTTDYIKALPQSIPSLFERIVAEAHIALSVDNLSCMNVIRLEAHEILNAVAALNAVVAITEDANKPIDYRVYHTDERLQRRFDSLARLLSLQPGFSICSAVTIVNGELIIATNSAGNASSALLAELLRKKMIIIRTFINKVHRKKIDVTSEFFSRLADSCVHKLICTGGTSQNNALLKQALHKLILATSNAVQETNTDFFSSLERDTLLGNEFTLLLPTGRIKETDQTDYGMDVFDADHILAMEREHHFFSGIPSTVRINHLHAEQLIVYYLKNIKRLDLQDSEALLIRLGISKLCCETCKDVIKDHVRLQARGTHNIKYEYTVNLLSEKEKVICPATPVRSKTSPTHSKPSPFFSPKLPSVAENQHDHHEAICLRGDQGLSLFDESPDASTNCLPPMLTCQNEFTGMKLNFFGGADSTMECDIDESGTRSRSLIGKTGVDTSFF